MKRKKVLFVITKSNWGGAQRYVYDLATGLDQATYEPIVALGGNGELKQKLIETRVETITLATLSRDISFTKEIKSAFELFQLIRRIKPHVLHVNSSKAGGMGCFLGRLALVPRVIFTAHGWAFNESRPYWQKLIFKFFHWLTVLLSHQTIAVSQQIISQLQWPLLKNKWIVIHNGRKAVDYIDRAQARAHFDITKQAFVTGTIGELHPVKQHAIMIKSVAELQNQGYAITHVIIGAGSEKEELQLLAKQLQVSDQIIFAGAIHEAARYLQAFDMYIQPSLSEALGYTIIEAAQAGLPIIASRVGGIPEIITHDVDGLLVQSGNTAELTATIVSLLTDKHKRDLLAKTATETGKRFSFKNMLQATTNVYDSKTTSSASAESLAGD